MTDPSTEPTPQEVGATTVAGPAASTGASKTFVVSTVAIASVVVLGLVLVITRSFGGGQATAPVAATSSTTDGTSPTSAGETSSTESDDSPSGDGPASPSADGAAADSPAGQSGGASVCGLDAVRMKGTVNIRPDATWELVGSTQAPSVKNEGPGKIDDDGFRSCFARTPTGSLVAAGNFLAMGSYAPVRKKFFTQSTVPGPGRDALLKKPIETSASDTPSIEIAGFHFLHYDGNTADIDIAIRASNGVMASGVFNLQWVDGDWKLKVADDGGEFTPIRPIQSLADYVPWSWGL